MPLCFAFGCSHKSGFADCQLYRFPVDDRQRKKWVDLCRMEKVVLPGVMQIGNDSLDSSPAIRCAGDQPCVVPLHVNSRCTSTIITFENDTSNIKTQQNNTDTSCETLRNSRIDRGIHIPKSSSQRNQDPFRGEREETEPDNFEKEIEEDDLASKLLLSIQVLPRIPKRKQLINDSSGLPSTEKESYRSVLERVETATNRGLGSYDKWSTSGWKRSNEDSSSEDRSARSHKNDKITKNKWSSRSKVDIRSNSNDGLRSKDGIKASKATKISASTSSSNNSQLVECLDDKNKLILEQNEAYNSKPGPLPTLPFEEQMRERAKLRSRLMGSHLETVDAESSKTEVCGALEKQASLTVNADSVKIIIDANSLVSKHLPECSSVKQTDAFSPTNNVTEKHSSTSKKYSDNSAAKTSSRMPSRNINDHHRKKTGKNDNVADKTKHSDHQVQLTSKAKQSPPLPHLPVLPLFASVCSSDNTSPQSVNLSDEKAPPVSKTVTFSCPEGSGKLSRRKGKMKKEPEKKHLKQEKLNLQQRVITEMKNYLRPYYVRRQISKEEYKDIMRRAVPRVCRDRQHEDSISSSRIHKYASAYIDKVLVQQKRSAGLSKNPHTSNKKSDIPPPPPCVQP